MEKYEKGVIFICGGVFFILIGFRVIKVYKNDFTAAASFHEKYGIWYKVIGISLIVFGAVSIFFKV